MRARYPKIKILRRRNTLRNQKLEKRQAVRGKARGLSGHNRDRWEVNDGCILCQLWGAI